MEFLNQYGDLKKHIEYEFKKYISCGKTEDLNLYQFYSVLYEETKEI